MGSETKAGASTSHNRRTHVLTMATVSITNFVTCRAPVAGARAARASTGAAVRAPVAVASTNGVSLGGARQGSLAGRVGARAARERRVEPIQPAERVERVVEGRRAARALAELLKDGRPHVEAGRRARGRARAAG